MIAGTLEVQMLANMARLQKDMTQAKGMVSSAMSGIERSVAAAKSALGALGIGLGIGYFASLIRGSLKAQDELSKTSQKLGVGVEALAGYQHAADLAGVSNESLHKGFKTLATQMFDASMGLAESKRNFAALGLEIKNTDGSLKSTEALMVEVADKFAKMRDGTEKSALAVKLFGRAGLDMIPMLNEGSKALAAMVAEGKRLNPVTAESARQAEVFNDNMNRLSKSLSAFGVRMLNDVLPVASEFAKIMAEDALSGDLKTAHKETDNLTKSLGPLGEALRAVLVFAANVSFVLKGIGTEIGGIGAQLASIGGPINIAAKLAAGKNPFSGAAGIHTEMVADAERARKAFDAYEQKLLTLGLGGGTNQAKATGAPPKLVDEAALKKAADEKAKLLKMDADGWVKYIEARNQEWEDELLAEAKLSEEHWKNEERLRQLDAAGWVAYIEATTQAYEDELLQLAALNDKATDEMTEFWKAAAQNMQGAMSNFFFDIMQGNLSDLGSNFKRTIDRMVADVLAAKAASALFGPDFGKGGNIGGLVGDFVKWGSSFFGGGKADGGPVWGGTPYLVGERGPELFVPRQSGTVVPNGQIASRRAITIINNFAPGTDRRTIDQAAVVFGQRVQRALARDS